MQKKVKLGKGAFIYPMPVSLVGTKFEGVSNFMTVSWISRVNASPAMIGISSHKSHKSNAAIFENKAFSVNFPEKSMAKEADYCGLASSANADKSEIFDVFYGASPFCPLIVGCPLCMECELVQTVELPSNYLFIASIKASYSEERFLGEDGTPDMAKMKPFVLSMPDNRYWSLGRPIAKAWEIGLKSKKAPKAKKA